MQRLTKPENLFILVGLICQAFTWDNHQHYTFLIVFFLWIICCLLHSSRKIISDGVQFIIILSALTFFYSFTGVNIFGKCISLGNGLVLLQLIRLTYQLNYRERILSIIIAITQIVIGTQVILGYSFVLVISATLILLPKSLYQIQIENIEPNTKDSIGKFEFKNRKFEFTVIFLFSLLFFIIFPRINIESNTNLYSPFSRYRDSLYLNKPELNTSLASLNENALKDNDIVLQIHMDGTKTKYLEIMSLDKYENGLWTISASGYLKKRNLADRFNVEKKNYRKIDIKNDKFKSKFLPVDGNVQAIEGNFFDNPYFTRNGDIIVNNNIKRKNKSYEYWTSYKFNSLSSNDYRRYTKHGDTSQRIITFIDSVTKNSKTNNDKAYAITAYLKNNFKYELGVPKLNEIYPVEDFLFNVRKGHCERFASALAYLLRTINVPAKVTVGYLVREYNQFGEYYNVRTQDLHAWTEAYFKDKGWVIFDATPVSERIRTNEDIGILKKISDYFEYIWYSKVINLSFGDQVNLLKSINDIISWFINIFAKGLSFIYYLFTLMIFILIIYLFKHKFIRKLLKLRFINKKRSIVYAEHFYGDMLKELEKQKIIKPISATPFELLDILKKNNFIHYNEAKAITIIFCYIKYGNGYMNEEKIKIIQQNLNTIKINKKKYDNE